MDKVGTRSNHQYDDVSMPHKAYMGAQTETAAPRRERRHRCSQFAELIKDDQPVPALVETLAVAVNDAFTLSEA